MTVQVTELLGLFFCLDAFRYHVHPENTAEADQRVDDAPAARGVARDDERAIDLDRVVGEPVQVAEGCVAGAEVVQVKLYSELSQGGQLGNRRRLVLEQRVLGDLEMQRLRRQARFFEDIGRSAGKLRLTEHS